MDALARMIVLENGKNITEALAEVAKANETVEYACSLPQLAQGKILKVSSQVMCEDCRVPLGVVASIVPFNFPRKLLQLYTWTLCVMILDSPIFYPFSIKIKKTVHSHGPHVDVTYCVGHG